MKLLSLLKEDRTESIQKILNNRFHGVNSRVDEMIKYCVETIGISKRDAMVQIYTFFEKFNSDYNFFDVYYGDSSLFVPIPKTVGTGDFSIKLYLDETGHHDDGSMYNKWDIVRITRISCADYVTGSI